MAAETTSQDLQQEVSTSRWKQLFFGWLVPFGSGALILTAVHLTAGSRAVWVVLGLAASVYTVAGKFVVFAGLHPDAPADPWQLALFVVYLDMVNAYFVTYNFDLLYRLPLIGRRIKSLRRTTLAVLMVNPWMEKFTFTGVAAFVCFPVGGTGALGGAILGQSVGLHRQLTLVAILVGAIVGSVGMAGGAVLVGSELQDTLKSPWLHLTIVSIIIGLMVVAGRWFLRQARELEKSGQLDEML